MKRHLPRTLRHWGHVGLRAGLTVEQMLTSHCSSSETSWVICKVLSIQTHCCLTESSPCLLCLLALRYHDHVSRYESYYYKAPQRSTMLQSKAFPSSLVCSTYQKVTHVDVGIPTVHPSQRCSQAGLKSAELALPVRCTVNPNLAPAHPRHRCLALSLLGLYASSFQSQLLMRGSFLQPCVSTGRYGVQKKCFDLQTTVGGHSINTAHKECWRRRIGVQCNSSATDPADDQMRSG